MCWALALEQGRSRDDVSRTAVQVAVAPFSLIWGRVPSVAVDLAAPLAVLPLADY
jgi:hypothetical protein